jgi:trimethylamine--corrinoid protein Co-methyltransferase
MLTNVRPLAGQTAHVLDQVDLLALHDATLQLLEDVGAEFQDEEALDVFRRADGASVEGSRVRLASNMVERVIEQAPGGFVLRARNPDYDLTLGEGRVHYTSAFGATFVSDSVERVFRKATLEDVERYVRIADNLENVHYILTPFVPQDLPPAIAEIYAGAAQYNNTEKHVAIGVPTSHYMAELWEMGQLVAEATGVEGPLYSLGCTINSPLVYSHEMLPKIMFAAEHDIPLRIVSGALASATAPVTLAGALAVQNAEILAGVALCQLINPGCPLVYGTFVGGMDMRTGKWAAAGAEMSLATAASAQLCAMYDIPLGYGTGGITDSRVPDVRAGLESGLTTLAAALCGVEVIHDGVSGLMAGGMAISFEQFILDNEIAKWTNRFLRGIDVNPETLALDVIKDVGPGGHFLEQRHTLNLFREEHLISPLMSREYLLEWPASEAEDIVVQAREQVEEILASHHPPELDPEVKTSIQGILTRIGGERAAF